jgi:hypothetical protein
MENKSPVLPTFCPICGRDSLAAFLCPGFFNLYRCAQGHWFFFDSLLGHRANDGGNKLNDLLGIDKANAARTRRIRRNGNLVMFPKILR